MNAASPLHLSIDSSDFLRRSAAVFSGQKGHKEWLHFAAYGGGVDVLANFSVVDDVRSEARAGGEFGRITCLVRGAEWDGDIDAY